MYLRKLKINLYLSIFSVIFASHYSLATEKIDEIDGDNFVIMDKPKEINQNIAVPAELTNEQLQKLRTEGALSIDHLHLRVMQWMEPTPTVTGKICSWIGWLNPLAKTEELHAQKVEAFTPSDFHPSQFMAIYQLSNGEVLNILGEDQRLTHTATKDSRENILNRSNEKAKEPEYDDLETGEADTTDAYAVTFYHIRLSPEALRELEETTTRVTSQLATYLSPVDPQNGEACTSIISQSSHSALREGLLDAGQYIFSFGMRPIILANVPHAATIHPVLESIAVSLGYPTLTHLAVDFTRNGGRLSSPLLNREEEKEKKSDATAIAVRHDLHAVSRALGYAVSFIPYGSAIRSLGTMYVNRQGYPTITHWVMNHKELTDAQVAEIYNSQTKLAEEAVALGVKTFIPYGSILVAVSHTAAYILFGESSFTAVAIKSMAGK